MTKANECTCPSGDGSLRHPCPAHIGPFDKLVGSPVHNESEPDLPPLDEHLAQVFETGMALSESVEQAGGDERAAFEKIHTVPRGIMWNEEKSQYVRVHEKHCSLRTWNSFVALWAGWMARAALAQPSPASDLDPLNLAPHAKAFNEAPAEALKPEQPEIVATLFTPNEKVHDDIGFKAFAVAGDCDKDGGEFYDPEKLMTVAQHERIAASRWERAMDLMGEHVARISEKLTKERDAALAEVEALRAENSKLSEALDRWPLIRDSLKLRLADALARLAELEKQEPVAWMHDQPNRVDVIHRDVKELLQRVPGSNRGIHRPLDVSEHYTIPLYAAPAAQAQHSVPEGVTIERDVAGTIHIKVGDFDFIQLQYQRPYTDNASTWKLAERIASLLAAAPGNSVPQAWLDVQAERRRQITAEGWTPEHDDLYCAAELPRAAAAYILNGANDEAPAIWPFVAKWWKPRDARSNYVRASALILAEIERLDRAAANQGGPRDA
ncbi:hypothetical protein [Pseudomonas aeruginosa]|uniref:hypothetical protein n=1 Tax=Pseudomonas aeruginosa TaxID=287 RepID=UPI003DAA1B71